jgi:hypothetical protein
VPENLAKFFRLISTKLVKLNQEILSCRKDSRDLSLQLVKANQEILSGRRDSRNLSLPQSRKLVASVLHQKLGLETKARIERIHFLNGTITWERVDKHKCKSI